MRTPFAILLLMSITLNSCEKNSTKTTFFECKIDGQWFRPKYETGFGYRSIDVDKTSWSDSIAMLIGGEDEHKRVSILIGDKGSIKLNKPYQLNTHSKINSGSYFFDRVAPEKFSTNTLYTGELIITQQDNEAISGKFFFTGYDTANHTTVQITDGKFYILEK